GGGHSASAGRAHYGPYASLGLHRLLKVIIWLAPRCSPAVVVCLPCAADAPPVRDACVNLGHYMLSSGRLLCPSHAASAASAALGRLTAPVAVFPNLPRCNSKYRYTYTQ